jgi:hypothetical protein
MIHASFSRAVDKSTAEPGVTADLTAAELAPVPPPALTARRGFLGASCPLQQYIYKSIRPVRAIDKSLSSFNLSTIKRYSGVATWRGIAVLTGSG